MKRRLFCLLSVVVVFLVTFLMPQQLRADQRANYRIVNKPPDMSTDFNDFKNTYYLADSLSDFNPEIGQGTLTYRRHEYVTRMAFNNMQATLAPVEQNEFPAREYEASPTLPFAIDFISPRAVRIQANSGFVTPENRNKKSLMLVNGKAPESKVWDHREIKNGYKYTSKAGYSVIIKRSPWKIEFYDSDGKLLTHTVHKSGIPSGTYTPVMPFAYVRRASDYSRSFNAVFSLSPDEKIYGGGESYTQFNKRGQKVVLATTDANGTQNEVMYKPVPFFMSSRGYGMFIHTSSPITADIGKHFNGVNSLMIGDSKFDMFLFFGEPKTILDEYTDLTGKAAMPPLWSFGFWMSRITYMSEEEGRDVAKKLRKHKIPSDVIHFDTGWFETDWRCNYKFAQDRFSDAEDMIKDLKDDGFHICLWQIPYFTPNNTLFPEIIDKELYVKNKKGNLPTEDAILDFSNPATVDWYQDKIGGLLKMGVGAIKVDFGEAAPYDGIYHSGRTGFYEHNLYPLRYNKAVAEITQKVTGEQIMWARSTWAGSQRYPVHWGGDPACTNTSMSATLRGGLSIGLTGFSFWSHDIGGFVKAAPENLYKRWTPFGMLTSHTRSHGHPPTEPWEYGKDFLQSFRKAGEMRYKLMPYIYAQAKHCTETGLPMLRALFVEYPDDPGTWNIDDQYLFGSDMLVAPLFEDKVSRQVYLPGGNWIDYQTGKKYSKGWHSIEAGELPIVVLVKEGSVISHIKLAQSTMDMDWSELELVLFSDKDAEFGSKIFLPDGDKLQKISLKNQDGELSLMENPLRNKVDFQLTSYQNYK